MGFLSLRPVEIDPVKHGIGDGNETRLFQILAQIMDVIGNNAVLGVHIGLMGEDVQRTGGVQFHGQGNVLGFRFRLFQKLLPHGAEGSNNIALLAVIESLCTSFRLRLFEKDVCRMMCKSQFLIEFLIGDHESLPCSQ